MIRDPSPRANRALLNMRHVKVSTKGDRFTH